MIYILTGAVLLTALLTYLAVSLASARRDKIDTAVMMEVMKAQMAAESERVLKAREEELEHRARSLFESLSAGLDKDMLDALGIKPESLEGYVPAIAESDENDDFDWLNDFEESTPKESIETSNETFEDTDFVTIISSVTC